MRSYVFFAAIIAVYAVVTLAGWYPSRLSQQEAMYATMLYTMFPAWLVMVLIDSRAQGLRPTPRFWIGVALIFVGLTVYSAAAYIIEAAVPAYLGALCLAAGLGGCSITLPYVRTLVDAIRAKKQPRTDPK